MRIAICDSSYNFLNAVREEICKMNKGNYVYLYSSYEDLNKNLSSLFDAIIINTEIGSENGIKFAVSVKDRYPETEIIFVTQFGEKYAQMIFYHTDVLRPFAYFVKPVNRSYLRRMIAFLEKEIFRKHCGDILLSCTDGSFVMIPAMEISHIEHNNRISVVYNKNGESYECRKQLSQFEKLLPSDIFVYCSKSGLVNLSEVLLMEGQEIKMKNGDTIFASRNYKTVFKEELNNYITANKYLDNLETELV